MTEVFNPSGQSGSAVSQAEREVSRQSAESRCLCASMKEDQVAPEVVGLTCISLPRKKLKEVRL